MRVLLAVCLLALPVCGTWQRHVMTPKTSWIDTPNPHPLGYFTQYPMLRDASGDFCYLCTPEKKLAEAKKVKVKSDLTLVGTLAGFAIYDLYYRFETPSSTDTKLILVKSGPNQYREIYQRVPTQVDAQAMPSRLVTVGGDQFLEARYVVGGKSTDTYDYFWFDKTGSTLVDFRPILAAARSVLPARRTVLRNDDEEELPGTHYLWKHGRPLRCQFGVTNEVDNRSGGVVYVEFKFDQGLVVVVKTSYDPDARINE